MGSPLTIALLPVAFASTPGSAAFTCAAAAGSESCVGPSAGATFGCKAQQHKMEHNRTES